jgi:hypothetical protein
MEAAYRRLRPSALGASGRAALTRRVGGMTRHPKNGCCTAPESCCIGTIKNSATYRISGTVGRRAVALWELVENKRQPLKKKTLHQDATFRDRR